MRTKKIQLTWSQDEVSPKDDSSTRDELHGTHDNEITFFFTIQPMILGYKEKQKLVGKMLFFSFKYFLLIIVLILHVMQVISRVAIRQEIN